MPFGDGSISRRPRRSGGSSWLPTLRGRVAFSGPQSRTEKAGDVIKKGHVVSPMPVKLRPNEYAEAFRWRLLKRHLQRHRDKQRR